MKREGAISQGGTLSTSELTTSDRRGAPPEPSPSHLAAHRRWATGQQASSVQRGYTEPMDQQGDDWYAPPRRERDRYRNMRSSDRPLQPCQWCHESHTGRCDDSHTQARAPPQVANEESDSGEPHVDSWGRDRAWYRSNDDDFRSHPSRIPDPEEEQRHPPPRERHYPDQQDESRTYSQRERQSRPYHDEEILRSTQVVTPTMGADERGGVGTRRKMEKLPLTPYSSSLASGDPQEFVETLISMI